MNDWYFLFMDFTGIEYRDVMMMTINQHPQLYNFHDTGHNLDHHALPARALSTGLDMPLFVRSIDIIAAVLALVSATGGGYGYACSNAEFPGIAILLASHHDRMDVIHSRASVGSMHVNRRRRVTRLLIRRFAWLWWAFLGS
jgi:hypothetical protein